MRDIVIHTEADFAAMRLAGNLAAAALDMIGEHVGEGVTTAELDRICHEFVVANGGIPASLGYMGYSHATCISVNEEVCHGIPGSRTLSTGDILNIDLAVIVDGWHGDTSRMYAVGNISSQATRLIKATYEAMMAGIKLIRPGARLGEIGWAMEKCARSARFAVVRDFCGHGVGRVYHAAPDVLNYGRPGRGAVLRPGMFLTVEPILNVGGDGVEILEDGWTAVTEDGGLSAQWEHTVAVTETGFEIFTLSAWEKRAASSQTIQAVR
ncbi:methionine aminopeptidase [Acetobacter nitrogenifigens DSM 23921 = NBRC 105050]|uniref:Methionine aminopeptidase n=1 Tax=Acetobacter nitrogenifigens DSM 23921 = NBRC 105050 TaxID=1120919 RepID=A0A511XD46_9PROT|nr:type I methionyl aminopeptidase [Acetobacter nitrogenifigens]GBQ90174.1 methionine aminopeptidase [Acetobacter nitrogenifigens DSM 23921 = NBRC 105050]GEN60883.1 methionine aminopeptidase [Acetobacter nitrogenifigens DSM 23921 = NBRC 105050]